jgi:hypothetical protein
MNVVAMKIVLECEVVCTAAVVKSMTVNGGYTAECDEACDRVDGPHLGILFAAPILT